VSVRKKTVWLFAGGAMQEIMCKRIAERGMCTIITDRHSDCACSRYADEFVEIDTFDVKRNVEKAKEISKKFDIVAAVTTGADCHQTVARVAQSLGLHGIDPNIADICRYKHLTRDILSKAGIRQPRFKLAESRDDALVFLQELGADVVIKATDNSGSRGFYAVRHADELTNEVFEIARENGTTGQVLVEEMLEPANGTISEQSVETVWYDGKMYWLNWVDRIFGKDCNGIKAFRIAEYEGIAKGVEVGHVNPAMQPNLTKDMVKKMIFRAGMAIGMGTQKGGHILKTDIMLTDDGPVIIELTPRLSGGWDSSGTTPARGGDFVGGVLGMALREDFNVDFWNRYFTCDYPERVAAIVTSIAPGARDCIGRQFTMGVGFDRDSAIEKAVNKLKKGDFNVSVEQ